MSDLQNKLRGPRTLALAAGFGSITLLGAWSALAPLASATLATGIVSPDSGRQTVQHLEGGILDRLLVSEGDTVAAGQPIAVLVDARAKAAYDSQIHRRTELAAARIRLKALAAGGPADFAPLADDVARDPSLGAVLANEAELLRTRRSGYKAKVEGLSEQIRKSEAVSAAFRRQIDATEAERATVVKQLDDARYLLAKGLTTRPRMLALEARMAQIDAQRASFDGQIAASASDIERTRTALSEEESTFRQQLGEDLAKTDAEAATVANQIAASTDAIGRQQVKAPEAGTVVSLKVRTPGAVVAQGGAIADILPTDGSLVFEVRVRPVDIAHVASGQTARVTVTAFSPKEVPVLPGYVRKVGADAVQDPVTREFYYRAEVAIDRDEVARLAPGAKLQAGMPVQAFIEDHPRTLLTWLAEPLMRGFAKAGREY
jgi:HlyD family type I secretion membrane fusion protein